MSRATKKPTHRVYAVVRRRTRMACWVDIGEATSHKDGRGFDLQLQSMPLTAEELVVRTVAERILSNGAIAARYRKSIDARRAALHSMNLPVSA